MFCISNEFFVFCVLKLLKIVEWTSTFFILSTEAGYFDTFISHLGLELFLLVCIFSGFFFSLFLNSSQSKSLLYSCYLWCLFLVYGVACLYTSNVN